MSSMHIVSVRWNSEVITPEAISFKESHFHSFTDWFRYSAMTYMVWSNLNSMQVSEVFRLAFPDPRDSVMVTRVVDGDYWGWAPPETWHWMSKYMPSAYTRPQNPY